MVQINLGKWKVVRCGKLNLHWTPDRWQWPSRWADHVVTRQQRINSKFYRIKLEDIVALDCIEVYSAYLLAVAEKSLVHIFLLALCCVVTGSAYEMIWTHVCNAGIEFSSRSNASKKDVNQAKQAQKTCRETGAEDIQTHTQDNYRVPPGLHSLRLIKHLWPTNKIVDLNWSMV